MDIVTRRRFTSRPFQVAATALFTCASAIGLHAQTTAATPVSTPALNLSIPKLDLSEAAGYSSSLTTDKDTVEMAALDYKLLPADASQPPPRRRYGRPRYNDSSHNPDGSNKYGFLAGAGFTLPTQDTHTYLSPSYGFQVGAGRNFNKKFSLFLQFDYDRFGFQNSTLNNQLALYNQEITLYDATASTANQVSLLSQLGGNTHVWSFTLDPTYNFYSREALGAYVVGGVGFYHKAANFTTPATGYYEDYFGNIYAYQANQSIDSYVSNAPGFNGGIGLTFKPSRFAGERFYAEARYVYVLNSQRSVVTLANVSNPVGVDINNQFPANSNRTSYIPIKFGIRF